MKDVLRYKGFEGSVHYSREDDCLWGKLLGVRGAILYEGNSLDELKRDFEAAVDDYLAELKAKGESPPKPYKGVFSIRTDPETHRRLASVAEARGVKLNTLVNEALESYLESKRA
jgi:predicted HicB family RNase H-like nuclease